MGWTHDAIHVDGIETAIDNFDRILTCLHSEAVLQIFQVAGDAVAQIAQGMVHQRTGRTERAIFARAYWRDGNPYCIVGVETHEPAHGHDVVPWAGYLEFGTVKMDAHPYLRPAADEMEGKLLELVGTALAQLIGDQIH